MEKSDPISGSEGTPQLELVFPFKNISIHNLLEFLEKGKIKDYILIRQEKYPFSENFFEKNISFYRDSLPNFENEILQIINTTNQATIGYYFAELHENALYVIDRIDKKVLETEIEKWNKEELIRFEEEINKETEEYFKSENRKLKHLEEYETCDFGLLWGYKFGGAEKTVKKINYNFYCIEKEPDLIDTSYTDEYYIFLIGLTKEFLDVARKYGIPYNNGEIKSKVEKVTFNKPVVFVEGEHDINFIQNASTILKQDDILKKIELRQRGGFGNLDKIWTFYQDTNWETIPQKKLLLYDCDTKKENKDFGQRIFKRIIPSLSDGIITKGIENLFPNDIINKAIQEKKAFVDFEIIKGVKRGKEYEEKCVKVNDDEKKNFCLWMCKNGTADDFKNFTVIFEIIQNTVLS